MEKSKKLTITKSLYGNPCTEFYNDFNINQKIEPVFVDYQDRVKEKYYNPNYDLLEKLIEQLKAVELAKSLAISTGTPIMTATQKPQGEEQAMPTKEEKVNLAKSVQGFGRFGEYEERVLREILGDLNSKFTFTLFVSNEEGEIKVLTNEKSNSDMDGGVDEMRRVSENEKLFAEFRQRTEKSIDGTLYSEEDEDEDEDEKMGRTNPNNICGHCGNPLDAATTASNHSPREGDISICVYCGNINIFQKDMSIRELTPKELEEIQKSPQFETQILPAINFILSDKNPLRGKRHERQIRN